MRQVYEPTHYGMGFTTLALTFKVIQANEGHDLRAQDHDHQLRKQQDDP
jgi:hypothetical protein